MNDCILWFQHILRTIFPSYFNKEKKGMPEIPLPESQWLHLLLPENIQPAFEEQIVLLLALMPHISPQTLDLFFLQNKELDRPHTEFGGWKGVSHGGFLPTGQTAAFLIDHAQLTINNTNSIVNYQLSIINLFSKDHWFHKHNILHLEGQGKGEPFLSGRLVVSDEFLARIYGNKFEPEYNSNFPAKRITTPLDWNDLVLPYHLREEIDDIIRWLDYQEEIRERWQLGRIIRPGYRCLFYGLPGTGKTLTATLLGKQNNMDVYRVDLSMIVSKYIGETEKNLAKVFDKAGHQNWILFFDEADALFGQRTETQSSNDRYANQEVAYLLQRIEDYPGMVILATNLKENIDEAFFRRFQSSLYFPVPDQRLRYQLWKNMLPPDWLDDHPEELLNRAATFNLSGGSIVNAIQTCAIKIHSQSIKKLNMEILKFSICREQAKEGKLVRN
ncbi:MAG: ATP-binding protein [Dysgonamonadaceae bacterium]|nr:ATP-binding protein [Dysgonamonadaceae bacterium]